MIKLADLEPELDRHGKNLIINCPYCGPRECGISLNEGHKFGCWRKKMCGEVGNIFTVLKHIGQQIGYSAQSIDSLDKLNPTLLRTISIGDRFKDIDLEMDTIALPKGWTRVYSDPYLESRGFDQYEKHAVGRTLIDFRVKKDYVIFVLKHGGEIVGWIGRHIKDKKWIELQNKYFFQRDGVKNKIKRYSNSPGTDFAKILYGIEECTENTSVVLMTEGLFDKFNTDKILDLDSQEDVKCCCTFKCAISDEQLARLVALPSLDTVILLYDPDVIPQIIAAANKIAEFFTVLIGFDKTGKDPGDMNDIDFQVVLNEVKPLSHFVLDYVDQPLL